jgi:hypothetical protein
MRANPFNKLMFVLTGIFSIVSLHVFVLTLKNRDREDDLSQSQVKIFQLKEEIQKIVRNTSERISESNKNIESLLDTFSNKTQKLIGSDDIFTIINNFYTNWNEFLSKLSTEQLGAVAHASSALFILICLFNIMSIVYANFLLDKLNIEEKYPRIGKIIRVRSKFVHFNLFINFSLIIFTLLGILYVNYLVLTL